MNPTGLRALRALLSLWVVVGALLHVHDAAADPLAVGAPAPGFSLQGTDGRQHSLAEHAGHYVVIAWFPRAFTSGCTIECKSLAANSAKLREYDFTYYMASVDPIADNARFADAEHADFPLLSDPDKSVAKAYDVLNMMGVASRHTIYIGPDGRVLAIDTNVRPATSAEDMLARLQQLGVPKRH